MSGYRHCVTEDSADRQQEFEQALLELMGQKPLGQITIGEICGRVGLSRKSFYRYFSSREDCLNALVDHAILELSDLPLDQTRMRELLERYFSYWKQNRNLLEALCRSDLVELLYHRSMLCAAREFGIREYLRDEEGSYYRSAFFISGLTGVLLSWHQEGYQTSPGELAVSLCGFLPSYPQGVF